MNARGEKVPSPTAHAEQLRKAAIKTARLMSSEPGTSFGERTGAYLASGLIIVCIAAVIFVLVFADALRPPRAQRAFVPDWRCDHYGVGGEVCERIQHTSESGH
ncbi:MAG: hypothetical protein KGL16_14185 [Acidobacteriota bacterium]|nr:hypothetical protein [Acidobacteriota bacterium]